MRMSRSLSITSLSFFVIRSRCSRCCFQNGTTTSIRNLFGWFRSSYKCHRYVNQSLRKRGLANPVQVEVPL